MADKITAAGDNQHIAKLILERERIKDNLKEQTRAAKDAIGKLSAAILQEASEVGQMKFA